MRLAAGGLGLALLAGCGGGPSLETPVGWWHDLEGGRIAELRPPPPGSRDPYPNLATIPVRPAAADVAAQQRIADQLAAQRDAAEAGAARDPVRPTPPPPKPPPPPAPDPNGNKVVVDAAPAPVPAAPAPKPAAKAAPIPSLSEVPSVPAAVASGALPDFAAAPPPPAQGFGDFTPPLASPPSPPAPAAAAPSGVIVAFSAGSATLPPSAPQTLSKFALGHRGVPVAVTGRGEAVLRSADAQSRAMDLAFKRVQAIAGALAAAGIPASNLRLHAEAAGNGGSATLLN